MMNQKRSPLFDALERNTRKGPLSFHVPGHKNGTIFPENARKYFDSILRLDMTELPDLDDLHAPQGIIAEAQKLASEFFGVDQTYFLVGGSTVGNLAMILASCGNDEEIIVQRNSHKSIFNGLELSGASPVFITPEFDDTVNRYTAPNLATLKKALDQHPNAKAVMLTYPDYFGNVFAIKEMIDLAHAYNVPILVDEAHGVHFSVDKVFPQSSLKLGADVVVQSAHKMAPAMTMGSYLHIASSRVSNKRMAHYLQLLQSSSPSYPIMATLDVARLFLASLAPAELEKILESVNHVREVVESSELWVVLPTDDPLKLTLNVKQGYTGYDVARLFEQEGIYPELATHNQVLFIHGLAPIENMNQLKKAVKQVREKLKSKQKRAIIELENLFTDRIQQLTLPYSSMQQHKTDQVPMNHSAGYVAAETIIPYPPGIPFILKGERITIEHIRILKQLLQQGATIQHRAIHNGISVFL